MDRIQDKMFDSVNGFGFLFDRQASKADDLLEKINEMNDQVKIRRNMISDLVDKEKIYNERINKK